MRTLSADLVYNYREKTFRSTPSLRLKNPQQAIEFVNHLGFALFWPSKGLTMPSLWCAVAGDRPVPDKHDDPGHITWSWKDQLLDQRVWYYARVIKKRNVMISLNTIPFFYALSPNFGEPENEIEDQYRMGLIPLEVKLIFNALLEKGPLDSLALRREAHLSGPKSNGPFNRALDILQKDLKVLPISIADVGTWHYAFVYELTHRYYPDLLEKSRFLSETESRTQILAQYMNAVGAITKKEVCSLFGWKIEEVNNACKNLEENGLIKIDIQMENSTDSFICLTRLL